MENQIMTLSYSLDVLCLVKKEKTYLNQKWKEWKNAVNEKWRKVLLEKIIIKKSKGLKLKKEKQEHSNINRVIISKIFFNLIRVILLLICEFFYDK